jgi:hypothetical protein
MTRLISSIPKHQYIYVDSSFVLKEPLGFIPAVWFGLVSIPGRMWGLNVLFECGAVYRNVPPHSISFYPSNNQEPWVENQSQLWDCYGYDFSVHEYTYLKGLECSCLIGDKVYKGEYLFTAAPYEDGFSYYPGQSKEFMFVKLDNGRLTIQPTNRVLFVEKSFTEDKKDSRFMNFKLQEDVYSCE